MPGWFGPWELLIVLAVVLLIFGPKRLPSLGRSLGQGARSFRDAITRRHDKDEDDEERLDDWGRDNKRSVVAPRIRRPARGASLRLETLTKSA